MNLKNKVVVITGSTTGLGKALALVFLKEQASVVINSVNKKELEKVVKEIGTLGLAGDVTKENDLKRLADFAVKKFGRIDIWVNNAGIWLPHKPIEETDWVRAHNLIEVNLFGTVYGSKIALTEMRKQNSGVIINIVSTSGLEGKVNETAYCASKFAASGFTRSLRKETESTKIKVIGVYPSRMKTNLFDESKPKNYASCMEPSYVARKIVDNLKLSKPKDEIIVKKK